jgi:hypothetical protein
VAVFLGMGSGQMVVLQELGFGLAIAVLLDAFVVRVIVAPAMISLIGDRYWWLPRWLEWLPRIDIEGRAPAAEAVAGADGTPGRDRDRDDDRRPPARTGPAVPGYELGSGI